MKKVCGLVLLLLLLTGCKAEASFYIDAGNISEKIFLSEDNDVLEKVDDDNYTNDGVEDLYGEQLVHELAKFEGEKKFEREFLIFKDYQQYRYGNSYAMKNVKNKSLIGNCYDEIRVKSGRQLDIETSSEFKCFAEYDLLSDVTFNIYSNKELVDTNADEVVDDRYTWYINRDNYMNKPIILKLKNSGKNISWFKIVGFMILAILCGIVAVMAMIWKKNDSSYSEY